MADRLGVGIVGLDHWYNAMPFLEQLKGSAAFQAVVVGHHDIDRARTTAEGVGAEATTDLRAVIHDPRVQLIATFTSTDQNAALCIEAAEQGKHILAIKPVGMTRQEAAEVVKATEQSECVFFPFESYARLTPLFQLIKRWVSEGRIGAIQTIFCSHEAALPVEWIDSHQPGWWSESKRTPGGGWIDHAIYQIDLVHWLTGANVTRVEGQVGNVKYKDLGVEDYGTASFLLDTNVIATCEAHWLAPRSAFRRVVEIIGTDGVILFDSTDDRIRVNGRFEPEVEGGDTEDSMHSRTSWQSVPVPAQQGAVLLEHLGEVLRGEVQPIATARDAQKNLGICLDFYESAVRIT